MMKPKNLGVINVRSADDSGWIGANESGKTNILLSLWKLNPAKEGSILSTADMTGPGRT